MQYRHVGSVIIIHKLYEKTGTYRVTKYNCQAKLKVNIGYLPSGLTLFLGNIKFLFTDIFI